MVTSGREANPDGRAEGFRPAYRGASNRQAGSLSDLAGFARRLTSAN